MPMQPRVAHRPGNAAQGDQGHGVGRAQGHARPDPEPNEYDVLAAALESQEHAWRLKQGCPFSYYLGLNGYVMIDK